MEESQVIRKPSSRQTTESAVIVFSPALDLRSKIQRKGDSSRPLRYIILLNGLNRKLSLRCVLAEIFVLFFFFQRMF